MPRETTRTRPQSPPLGVWASAGAAAAVLSFVGVHVMHPPGTPEFMTDTQVAAWIAPAAKQIAAGGSLGLLACLLLLVFAQGWSAQLSAWGAAPWVARLAEASFSVTAAALGIGATLQVAAGLSALEKAAEPSLAATLLNLYGILAISAWILLLPAVLAGLLAFRRGPRWVFIVSAVASIMLTLGIALPPVSWGLAGAWLIAVSVGCLSTRAVGQPRHSENPD
jgi:hypothetical protein